MLQTPRDFNESENRTYNSPLDRLDHRMAERLEQSREELSDLSTILGATKNLIRYKVTDTRKRIHDALLIKKIQVAPKEMGAY